MHIEIDLERDLTILAKMCACLDCTPNDILKIVKETAKDE